MFYDALTRFLKRLTTPSPTNTILPGRWRNVGKGRTDTPIPDPAYSKPKQGTVRMFTNVTPPVARRCYESVEQVRVPCCDRHI